MLPVESFTDAVSFLGYWDLFDLKITSKLCSSIAHRRAGEIRIFDLSDVECVVYVHHVSAFPHRPDDTRSLAYPPGTSCQLPFPDIHATIAFITEAFRNCIFGGLKIVDPDSHLLDALKDVANTMIVDGTLEFQADDEYSVQMQEMLDVVDAFRRVNKLEMWENFEPKSLTDTERNDVENVCRRRGITLEEHFDFYDGEE